MSISAVGIIAERELSHAVRSRVLLWMVALMALLSIALALAGGTTTTGDDAVNQGSLLLSLIHLVMYCAPLVGLLLSYDAVIDEEERGTEALMATYPVSRLTFLTGKYLGYVAVLGLALLLGIAIPLWLFGLPLLTAVELAVQGYASGIAFVGIGMALSARAGSRTSALVIALLCWLLAIFLFDLGLTGLLVATNGGITDNVVKGMLLLNPAQVGRLLGIRWLLSGADASMLGVEGWLASIPLLFASLLVWPILGITVALPRHIRKKNGGTHVG